MQKIKIISLRFWLPFLVFGTFLLLALIFTLSIRQSYEDDLYERSVHYIKQDMSELSRSMMEQLLEGDFNEADRMLTRQATKRSYASLIAVDANGLIYSSTDKALLETSANKSNIGFDDKHFQQTIANNREHIDIDDNNKLIQAYFPIKSVRTPYNINEKQFGVLYLSYDLSLAINRLWENTRQTVQIALLTGLLFASLFYSVLNIYINRPLHRLAQVTRRIAAGELGINSEMSGTGEFAELNEAINTLSTQLKKNIEQLEKSEKQKEEILWASDVGTWVYDVKSGTFSINQRWGEMLGYQPGELQLNNIDDWKQLLHPDEKETVLFTLQDKLFSADMSLEIEMRLQNKQQEWCWVKMRGRAVERTRDNHAKRLSGTITDIGKRKQAEAAMLMRDRSIESFVVGIIIVDALEEDMPIIYCNDAVSRITGYKEHEILGKNCRFLQVNDHQPEATEQIKRAIARREECHVLLRNYRKDGSLFWNDLKISPVMDEHGKLTNYIASLNDVTVSIIAEERLNILRRAVESTDSAMIIVDRGLMIEYVNPAFIETMGYSKEELIGRNHSLLRSSKVSPTAYRAVWERVVREGIWKDVFENTRKNGDVFRDKCTISAVTNNNIVTHFICIHEDVTREHELNQLLSYEATHDKLTDLINRAEFERRASRLIESITETAETHAMCFMDLDQFKVINDNCGHIAGDELLRQIGQLLKSVVRKRDTIARLGGDEFGVLMEHCSIEQAHRVANDILNAIQDFTFIWEARSFKLGISIGLVKMDKNINSLAQLLKQADTACYMAKDLGRNRIHIYYNHDNEIAEREGQMQWVERIYQALEKDLFCFYAQPIMKTSTGVVDHYELLIRMLDNNNETIQPGAFLPAAERYNIIAKIDLWVFDNVIQLLSENPEFVESIDCISINLSGQSLGDSHFISHIETLLKTNKVSTKKICFEITETAAISNMHIASEFIQQMRNLGCRFSLDDFGSGLSSFAYLKRLPVDYLKIDGQFVKDIVSDKIDLAMVRSMNEIGNVMGMETIAEFVENDEILDLLKDIGVDYVQGYGIAKPRLFQDIIDESNNK